MNKLRVHQGLTALTFGAIWKDQGWMKHQQSVICDAGHRWVYYPSALMGGGEVEHCKVFRISLEALMFEKLNWDSTSLLWNCECRFLLFGYSASAAPFWAACERDEYECVIAWSVSPMMFSIQIEKAEREKLLFFFTLQLFLNDNKAKES